MHRPTIVVHQLNRSSPGKRGQAVRRLLALMPLAVAALLAGCGNSVDQAHAAAGSMPPPEVSVVTVQPRDIATGFEYVGQTAGSRETEVRARISGILERRLYEEGSRSEERRVGKECRL